MWWQVLVMAMKKSRSSGIYFLVSMVLEILFGILASIIAMWFSRYREYRADAGSAQLVGKEKNDRGITTFTTNS